MGSLLYPYMYISSWADVCVGDHVHGELSASFMWTLKFLFTVTIELIRRHATESKTKLS